MKVVGYDFFSSACIGYGLPCPHREFVFFPGRKWRFDYCWPEHKVALEVEGGIYSGGRHVRGKGYENDMEKYSAAAARGWRILRCTPQRVLDLVPLVAEALAYQ